MDSIKRLKPAQIIRILVFSAAFCILTTLITALPKPVSLSPYETAYAKLYGIVFSSPDTEETVRKSLKAGGVPLSAFRVFAYATDGEDRAKSFLGDGQGLREAFDDALSQAKAYIEALEGSSLYVKVDIVSEAEWISKSTFKEDLDNRLNGHYRYGISFDENFQTSFTEEELNGYRLYDNYDLDGFMYKRMNALLLSQGREMLTYIPDYFIRFSCTGYFYDNSNAERLRNEPASPLYGIRTNIDAAPQAIDAEIAQNAEFLKSIAKDDGSFDYGRWPCTNNSIEGYNMLRHMGTVWALIGVYRDTGDESYVEPIAKAIKYFQEEGVAQSPLGASYVYDKDPYEIKLGGAGLAVCALVEYMEAFDEDALLPLAKSLGEGILSMQNAQTGGYSHILYYKEDGYKDFTFKEETRTVYYDGEATLALLYLYRFTGEEKWLEASKKAVGNFIREDYTQYRDHWVAYCLNEITKYTDTAAYYNFALRNIQDNLQKIRTASAESHIVLEFLMSSYELYMRMAEAGIEPSYLENFDAKAFIDTIFSRAALMQASRFYPELAIHMAKPNQIMGLFFIRSDEFRIRIDDLQHFIMGYQLYSKHYASLVNFQN